MGWDAEELTRLRSLLHNEPHVRGLGYNQYADDLEVWPESHWPGFALRQTDVL